MSCPQKQRLHMISQLPVPHWKTHEEKQVERPVTCFSALMVHFSMEYRCVGCCLQLNWYSHLKGQVCATAGSVINITHVPTRKLFIPFCYRSFSDFETPSPAGLWNLGLKMSLGNRNRKQFLPKSLCFRDLLVSPCFSIYLWKTEVNKNKQISTAKITWKMDSMSCGFKC